MKKFKTFRENRQVVNSETAKTVSEVGLPDDVTSLDETHTLLAPMSADRQNHAFQRTPPQVLIMRRKTVRQFQIGRAHV